MKYTYRPGHKITKLSPQIVGETLEAIRKKRGKLETETVLQEAQPEDSPIHPAFEWNDAIAAKEHRKEQARKLIRSIQVIISEQTEPIPLYIHVTTGNNRKPGYYQSIMVAHPDEFALAIKYLETDCEALLKRIRRIKKMSQSKNRKRKANIVLKKTKEKLDRELAIAM